MDLRSKIFERKTHLTSPCQGYQEQASIESSVTTKVTIGLEYSNFCVNNVYDYGNFGKNKLASSKMRKLKADKLTS